MEINYKPLWLQTDMTVPVKNNIYLSILRFYIRVFGLDLFANEEK